MTPQHTPHLLHSFASPLGPLWLSASDQGLSGLWFGEQRHLPDFNDAQRFQRGEHRYMHAAMTQLNPYFAGEMTAEDFSFGKALPLDLNQGTEFQQSVWQALLRIPMGGSTSYGAIAEQINKPAAVRAVGAAVGRNPIGILVPCHRVLGKDGSLTGYAGGLEKKIELLRLEGVLI
ncbi:methylated-DNA--[protein]-cysteine S-methyltransferase [Variovorax sp. PCZ-1]|uniref:methylated-DNA--[protein]-cysteine S-methyltransferase n=1 Tax=Variovorax sp. PCZ-1 TaxID=2835533 RepID=UPI001BCBCF8B|nr:methylated-DNA--[protein]-cysteine S-methyltransferase [Variovorax sp. PCZ-1]MBS7806328.1 methylated-DNA--[protein]-cysteine S-methyltransferase [Variovorax sp. PCZ-1]